MWFKSCLLLSMLMNIFCTSALAAVEPFTLVVKTDNVGSSAPDSFTLPLHPMGIYDFTVNWGDDTEEIVTTETNLTHTYVSTGTYTIKIRENVVGGFPQVYFNNGGALSDGQKVIRLARWGGGTWLSMEGAFDGCVNLLMTAPDAGTAKTSAVENFQYAWRNCRSLIEFPEIDTASGKDFSYAWEGCKNLTTFPLLNTASGTDFSGAWRYCRGLTTFPLLNTVSATNFFRAWRGCTGLTSFPNLNTTSVTNFARAWRECSGLTSFPLLNTASGTTFSLSWSGCVGLTDFPQLDVSAGKYFDSTWEKCAGLTSFPALNISQMRNGAHCFRGIKLPIDVYSNLLNFLATTNANTNVIFDGGLSQYTMSANSSRNALITQRHWTITDGGETAISVQGAPIVISPAVALAYTTINKAIPLSVLGADNEGERKLTYTWSAFGSKPGAVNFGANGTNAAKNTYVEFSEAGIYHLFVTLTDAEGLTATSTVMVTATRNNLNLLGLEITTKNTPPYFPQDTISFATKVYNVSENLVLAPITWTCTGDGSITPYGQYTVGATPGTVTITATSGPVWATYQLTISENVEGDLVWVQTLLPKVLEPVPTHANSGYTHKNYAIFRVFLKTNGSNGEHGQYPTIWLTGAAQRGKYNHEYWSDYWMQAWIDHNYTFYIDKTNIDNRGYFYRDVQLDVSDFGGDEGPEDINFSVFARNGDGVPPQRLNRVIPGMDSATAYILDEGSPVITQGPKLLSKREVPTTTEQAGGFTASLSCFAEYSGGNAKVNYTWSATGPSEVQFSENGTNGSMHTIASCTTPGTYTFTGRASVLSGKYDQGQIHVTFLANQSPIMVSGPTSASPSITGTSVALSALASDDAPESYLTYTWSAQRQAITDSAFDPNNRDKTRNYPVSFSRSGKNEAKSTIATFNRTGTYNINVTVTDVQGLSTQRSTTVTVIPTLKVIVQSQNSVVASGETLQLSAQSFDQFNRLWYAGEYDWSLSGEGSLVKTSQPKTFTQTTKKYFELQTATYSISGLAGGTWSVTAKWDHNNGIQVKAWDRQLSTVYASASPKQVTGTTTTLQAILPSELDTPERIYTWSTVGYVPAPVTFSVNGSNAAKNTVVTFTKSGTYLFQLAGANAFALADTDGSNYVQVTVRQTRTKLLVSPSTAVVVSGGQKTFTAQVVDQFSQPMENKEQTFNWSASGGNSISPDGVFSGSAVGSSTVTCSAGALSGSASVTVLENATVMDSRKPTQVWIEKLADPFPEPASGSTANKAVFRLYVRNPPYSHSWAHPDGSIAGWYWWSKTHVVFSGTALQYSGNIYVGYDYSAYIFKEKVASAPYSPHFYSGVGPLPASGLWGSWVIDNGNNITLAYVDIFVSTSSGDIIGAEGSETIVATIQPLNPALAGYTEITPEGKSNTATATIHEPGYLNTPPKVVMPAAATSGTAIANPSNLGVDALTSPVLMSAQLSVLGSDNLAENALTYSWEAIGSPPAPVQFTGTNRTNEHKNTTAYFSRAGDYSLLATITDREGLIATSLVKVTVQQAVTPLLKITPETISLLPGQQYQFSAVPVDQFGHPISQWLEADAWKPTHWEVTGGGSMSDDGVFTAGPTVSGPFTVIASSPPYKNPHLYAPPTPSLTPQFWSCSGRASVSIVPAPTITVTFNYPAANAVITSVPFWAEVSVTSDIDNVIDEVRLDGELLKVKPATPYVGGTLIDRPSGPYRIYADVETIFGARTTAYLDVLIDAGPLDIAILSPPDGNVSQQNIFVTARRPSLTTNVTMNGQPTVTRGYEASAWIRLTPNINTTITAIGTDGNRTGQDILQLKFVPPPGYDPNGDDDGDGVPNKDDKFPNDPTENQDSDGDGIPDGKDDDPNDPNVSSTLIIITPKPSQQYKDQY